MFGKTVFFVALAIFKADALCISKCVPLSLTFGSAARLTPSALPLGPDGLSFAYGLPKLPATVCLPATASCIPPAPLASCLPTVPAPLPPCLSTVPATALPPCISAVPAATLPPCLSTLPAAALPPCLSTVSPPCLRPCLPPATFLPTLSSFYFK